MTVDRQFAIICSEKQARVSYNVETNISVYIEFQFDSKVVNQESFLYLSLCF